MVDAITAPAIDKEVGMMEGDEKDTTPGSAPLGPMSDEKEKVKEEEKKMGSGTAYFVRLSINLLTQPVNPFSAHFQVFR